MDAIHKKYIITGAPGTGKTTLINLLKNTIPCMDEVSRKVIISEQKANSNGTPWGDVCRFSHLVFSQSLKELQSSTAQVCDRSVLDLEAYLKLENKKIPEYLMSFPYEKIYRKTVFFAPTWFDIYCKDPQRIQAFNYCVKLEQLLLEQYSKKGFNIKILPKTTPSHRKEFILSTII